MSFLPIQLQRNILLRGTEERVRRHKKKNRRQHNVQIFSPERKWVLGVGQRHGNERLLFGICQFTERRKKFTKINYFVTPETNLPQQQLRLQISGNRQWRLQGWIAHTRTAQDLIFPRRSASQILYKVWGHLLIIARQHFVMFCKVEIIFSIFHHPLP